MIVVTGGTAEYKRYIERQMHYCAKQGIWHVCNDFGGLGFGVDTAVDPQEFAATIGGGLPAARFKPYLMQVASGAATQGELVVWLDGDAVPVRDLDLSGDWDAAVTLRPYLELGASGISATDWLNSGVVFVRNNAAGRVFLDRWRTQCETGLGDQAALNEVVGPGFTRAEWESTRNNVVTIDNMVRVFVLSCPEWNCWQFPPPDEARILHYKRGLRPHA